jgi:hypothetical protein
MKTYYERTPFGQEQRLNLGFGATCPVCNVQRGVHHKYGCQGEECPKCHGPIPDCSCEAISATEELLIIKAIENSFSSQEEAIRAGAGADNRKADSMTPTDKAVIMYFLSNCAPEMKAEIDKKFRSLFPGLEPCGTNEKGGRVFAVKDVAKALNIDESELIELAQTLEAEDDPDPPVGPKSTFH